MKEWKDPEELRPKPKELLIFVDKKSEETKHLNGVVCAEAAKCRCMRSRRCSKYMKMPGKCTGPMYLSGDSGKMEKAASGHDLVRRMDGQGGILVWCRKCSGNAWQRVGPKLMNCCKREQVGTKEYGRMLKRIQVLEDGRVLAKEARNWKIEGQPRRITRAEYQRLLYKFVMEGFVA